MEEMETIIFEIINNGGTAKSLVYEAMESSEKGDFYQAEQLLKEADQYLIKAHQLQTDIIHDEVRGKKHEVSVLFVHAQDHLMSCAEIRTLAENLIRMNKRIYLLEHK